MYVRHWTRSSANMSHLWWPSIETNWDPIWWFNLESNIGASATSVEGKRKMVAMWTDIPMRFFVSSSSPRGGKVGIWTDHDPHILQFTTYTKGCCWVDHPASRSLHLLSPPSCLASHPQLQWGEIAWGLRQLSDLNSQLSQLKLSLSLVFSLLQWCQKRM